MLRKVLFAVALAVGMAQPVLADNAVNPQADFKAFRKYFTERFPKVPLNDFVNGPYSMDAELRKRIGPGIYGIDGESFPVAVGRALKAQEATLANRPAKDVTLPEESRDC